MIHPYAFAGLPGHIRRKFFPVVRPLNDDRIAQLILGAVISYFNVTLIDLKSKSRVRGICYPRQVAMYLLRTNTGYSLENVAALFGSRDHTTVIHSVHTIKELSESYPNIKSELETIRNLIFKPNNL